jgi:type IV pilus biogenesis protein PilP
MSSNSILGFLAGAAMLGTISVCVSAQAAPATPGAAPAASTTSTNSTASDTAAQLSRLQDETMVLKAQLKKLDAQSQIAERSAQLNHLGDSADHNEVKVHAIEGVGAHLYATVSTHDNDELEVRVGDTLPGGLRIVSIKNNAVDTQQANGAHVLLPLTMTSSSGDSLAQTGWRAQTNGVPPLPSLPISRN